MGETDPTLLALGLSLGWFKLMSTSLVSLPAYTVGVKNRPPSDGPAVLAGEVGVGRK